MKMNLVKEIINAVDEESYSKVIDIAEKYALELVNTREEEIKQMLIESGREDLADRIIKTY